MRKLHKKVENVDEQAITIGYYTDPLNCRSLVETKVFSKMTGSLLVTIKV